MPSFDLYLILRAYAAIFWFIDAGPFRAPHGERDRGWEQGRIWLRGLYSLAKKHIISWRRGNKAKPKKSSKRLIQQALLSWLNAFSFSFSFYLYTYTYDRGEAGEREREGETLPVAFEINVLFSKGNESPPLRFFSSCSSFGCLLFSFAYLKTNCRGMEIGQSCAAAVLSSIDSFLPISPPFIFFCLVLLTVALWELHQSVCVVGYWPCFSLFCCARALLCRGSWQVK